MTPVPEPECWPLAGLVVRGIEGGLPPHQPRKIKIRQYFCRTGRLALELALELAVELADKKGLDERNIAAELVSELMDMKIGLTNRRVIEELKEERKKLDLLIKRGDREAGL